MATLRAGSIVRFTYKYHTGAKPEEITDDFKEVFVLQPKWQGKMHGIDLKRLTDAERFVLESVFDKKQKGKQSHIPLVNDILGRMDPIEEIKNPFSFYTKFVKVFLKNKDAYRTYFTKRMINVSVAKKSSVRGPIKKVDKPLFKKIHSLVKPLFGKS